MKVPLLILVFLALWSQLAPGQTIEYVKLEAQVGFMPVGNRQTEVYIKRESAQKHYLETITNKTRNQSKRLNLQLNKSLESAIIEFDSLNRLSSYDFKIDASLLSNLKRWANKENNQNLYKDYIEELISSSQKIISITPRNIKADSMDNYTVYDGRPFTVKCVYKIANNDSVNYIYSGNIDDGVKSKDINMWLPFFIIINKYNLFENNKDIRELFTKDSYYKILLILADKDKHQ